MNRISFAVLNGALALALTSTASAHILGTAENYSVIAGSALTNTGLTVCTGSLGVWPGPMLTGTPGGLTSVGTSHYGDAFAATAQADLTAGYINLQGRTAGTDLTGQDLGGHLLSPGVYAFSSSAGLTGELVLDAAGDPNAEFVFQIGSTLTTASSSTVHVINNGGHSNVYWQVGSSATLGTYSTLQGSIVALTSATLTTGASVFNGGVYARNGAVTLDSNRVETAATPEPISMSLLGIGALIAVSRTRRRSKRV